MGLVVAALCFVLFYVIALTHLNPMPEPTAWRLAFLWASVLWSLFVAACTELLSAFRLLARGPIIAAWIALALGLGGYTLWRVARTRHAWMKSVRTSRARTRHGGIGHTWARLRAGCPSPSTCLLLGLMAAVATLTLVTALAAPPNTPDTFTYHLARVMHWIQDGSLAPYPSHLVSQDIQPPWSEYVLLHLHLLTGTDAFDGLPQWFSYCGALVGVSLTARALGAGARGQILAAVIAASTHLAIIQASSTQNDLVSAYWVICATYFLVTAITFPGRGTALGTALGAGATVGLAFLTKATAYIYLAPFLGVFALLAVRQRRWRTLRTLVLIGGGAILINGGVYARNLAWSGTPLGPVATTRAYATAAYTPDLLLLNVARNVAVEFSTCNHQVNVTLSELASSTLRLARLDPDDPRATMPGSPPFQLRGEYGACLGDAYTVNPLQLILGTLAIALCVLVPVLRRKVDLLAYVGALLAAFLLFCFYTAWQAGSNRLLLGPFLLTAPCAGVVAEVIEGAPRALWPARAAILRGIRGGWCRRGITVVGVVFLVSSTPWVLYSQLRPVLGTASAFATPRVDQYFAAFPPAEVAYTGAVRFIAAQGCRQVGYYVSGQQDGAGYPSGAPSWEYPLWVLLDGQSGGPVRIEHVLVANPTASLTLPLGAFRPCAIFAIVQLGERAGVVSINGRIYRVAWSAPGFTGASVDVYLPDGPAARTSRPIVRAYRVWLISNRWPSGSRKKQRISPPHSTGGVKKTAPRASSVA